MNDIYWQPKALRQLRRIEPRAGARIRDAVGAELRDLSQARNVKALAHHDFDYRLRVGDYRVLFNFDGAIHIVMIGEVRKRDERTY